MTRQEIADLLEILKNQYPYVKIANAKAMLDGWEMCLGGYSAEAVYKAARLHMETCQFFPTVADINEKIVRAELVYREDDIEIKKLEDKATESSEDIDKKLDDLCRFVGLGYPNDIEDD